MVVAGDVREGRFGQAESSMVIKKSLMALTTLPRLVGAGEEFYVPVTVFVDEKGVGDVTLELRLRRPQVILRREGATQIHQARTANG